ncbi:MAG: hypothetical protein D4R74_12695 [Betaproteobacteria bacterium]|nr:MAG: hypothetical protein D4R74_12695 [Betaproteobacteria bacterium]
MTTNSGLEAALALAEAAWRRASEGLAQARTNWAEANDAWEKLISDRRAPGTDRRKSRKPLPQGFPDRRKSGNDRRIPEADIDALSRLVTERHNAYLKRGKAEADLASAGIALDAAAERREKAAAALR